MPSYRRFPVPDAAVNPMSGTAARVLVVALLAGLAALTAHLLLTALF